MITAYDEIKSWNIFDEWVVDDELQKVQIMDSKRLDKTTDLVEKIKFFQQGDFPHTKHGIFNPSVVQFGNHLKFIFRCEPSQATWTGYFMTDKGVPQTSTGELTQDGLRVNPPKPVESGMPLSCRPEDWRLFLYRENKKNDRFSVCISVYRCGSGK